MPTPPTEHPLRGIVYMLLATALVIPVMNTMAKALAADFHIVQVVWARFAGHLLCVTLVFWPRDGWRPYRARRPGPQLLRSVLMLVSNSCFISALPLVALATATAIMFTTPLLVTLLAIPLLGERVGRQRWLAVAVGLLGALIVVRPGAAFGNPGNLLVLAAAAAFSLYQVVTRKLVAEDSAATMIVYTALVATVASSLVVPFFFTWPEHLSQWLSLVALGVTGALAQFFIVKAVQHAPVSLVSPFQYTELVGATVFGLVVFGTFPDAWTWVGAAVIVLSGLYVAHRARVRQQAARSRYS